MSVVSSIDIFVSSKSYVRYNNLDHTKITRDRAIDTTVEISSSLRQVRFTCATLPITVDKSVSKPKMTDTTDQAIALALDRQTLQG